MEEIGHRRLKAWVSFTQHLCGLKEGQDVEIKRYTEVRGHGKGLGLEVRLCTVGRVKIGAAVWLEWGVCGRDMQPGLWRH